MQYYDKTTKKEGTMINKLHEIADQIDKLCKDMALCRPLRNRGRRPQLHLCCAGSDKRVHGQGNKPA
jgi:hypothetical protein